MAEFKISLQKTLTHEGGYVNDPDDLGKETYKGISRKAQNNWSGWAIIDRHKNNAGFPAILEKEEELQNLVSRFYFNNFWTPLNSNLIANQTTANSIFDFAVNSGLKTTVLIVQ